MDALALYRRGHYAEALSLAQAQGELKLAALALLALGKVAEAQTILETWRPQEGVAEAERLALLEAGKNLFGNEGGQLCLEHEA